MEEVTHQLHYHHTEYLSEIEHLVQHTHWPNITCCTISAFSHLQVIVSLTIGNGKCVNFIINRQWCNIGRQSNSKCSSNSVNLSNYEVVGS